MLHNLQLRPLLILAFFCVSVCCGLTARTVLAQEAEGEEAGAIRRLLTSTQPDMPIASIAPSPVPGLYEVLLQSGESIYVSADTKFLIPGDMYQSQADGIVNLGEKRRNVLRHDKIAALDEKDMIVFEAQGDRKATLTVFTDIDCPYCRKLHGEIEELNSYGVAVRYLAYPRTGLIDRATGEKTETYVRMISTWCAQDRKAMLTSAKRGGEVPVVECESPVEEQFDLGREVGVTGTPALVMEDGTMLPGYVPAAQLAEYLLGATPVRSGQ